LEEEEKREGEKIEVALQEREPPDATSADFTWRAEKKEDFQEYSRYNRAMCAEELYEGSRGSGDKEKK